MNPQHESPTLDALPSEAEVAYYMQRGRRLQAQAMRDVGAAIYRTIRRWLAAGRRASADRSGTLSA